MVEYVVDLTGVETREVVTFDDRLAALCGLPVRERIVRCKDCKYGFDEGFGYLYCGRRPRYCFETRADGFCHLGEPRKLSNG